MDKLIPERLTNARVAMGISKTEAARRCGLTKIGYCRYEYGTRTPSIQTTEVLAHRLNTSVNYLIGTSESMEPDSMMIDRNSTPYLFELCRSCAAAGEETAAKLLAYYKEISKEH